MLDTLPGLLAAAVTDHGDRPLLLDPALDRAVTYREFDALVERAAAALRSRGAAPGDRVALAARNGLEAAVGIWACARAELVYLGLPADGPAPVQRALLSLTRPALVLAQPQLRARLGQDTGASVLDSTPVLAEPPPARVPLPEHRPDPDRPYMLIPTSGTTAQPRAVRVTGRMVGHAAVAYRDLLGLTASDRTAIHLPFGWVSGHITQLAPSMLAGGSAVTIDRFSTPVLLEVTRRHAVTWLDVVPAIWELLLRDDQFGVAAMPRVRVAVFGGAPARPDTLDRVRARLPGVALVDVYAQSETCAPVTALLDAQAPSHPGSVGRALPYVALRVVDGDGRPLAAGQVGALQVRSPTVSPGYWGHDEPLLRDGWYSTADLASLDEEGYLTLAGRDRGLVIRGGVNISLAAVEQALLSCPGVAEASAVGLAARAGDQKVAAAVVARPGAVLRPAELRQAVALAVGGHAQPRPLLVLDELPRNANGKVDPAAVARLLGP